jgi:hypothetical protein
MSKSFNINEAGDEILENANVLAVKTSFDEAKEKIEEVRESYITDEFVVENSEDFKNDCGIVVTLGEDNPSFKIEIYVEVLEDNKND